MNPAWNVSGSENQEILGEIAYSDYVAGLSDLLRSLIDKSKGGHFCSVFIVTFLRFQSLRLAYSKNMT